MRQLMYWVSIVAGALGLMLIVLTGLTLWAIDKSRERIVCYKAVIAYNETVPYSEWKGMYSCPQPDAVERLLRKVLI